MVCGPPPEQRRYGFIAGVVCGCVMVIVGMCISIIELARPMPLRLVKMTDELGKGAQCLDGSRAGYYHRKGKGEILHIHLEGGGWCFDEEHCARRSNTNIGSSKGWVDRISQEGIIDDSCNKNPTLCQADLVYIPYCDGGSYTGAREEPLRYDGKDLHFKGHQILVSVLKYIHRDGYLNASRVLLSGDSAGGLGIELNANFITEWIMTHSPSVEKVGVMVSSGFFPDAPNAEGELTYPTEMKNVFELSRPDLNATNCDFLGTSDEWRCMFAQNVISHIDPPLFLVQSKVDSFQMLCTHGSSLPKDFPNDQTDEDFCKSDLPAVGTCALNTETCTDDAVKDVNNYMKTMESLVFGTGFTNKAGNGLFFHTCKTHSSLVKDRWYPEMKIGSVSMQDAVLYWLDSNLLGNPTAAVPSEVYNDECEWHVDGVPRNCNPTCGDDYYPPETSVVRLAYKYIYRSLLRKNSVLFGGAVTTAVGVLLLFLLFIGSSVALCFRSHEYDDDNLQDFENIESETATYEMRMTDNSLYATVVSENELPDTPTL